MSLRIRAFTYDDWSGFQLLQERRWWGWKTIDHEEVPPHARISLSCCGDTGGWVSKFANLPVWPPPPRSFEPTARPKMEI